jgi:hypothetical protein
MVYSALISTSGVKKVTEDIIGPILLGHIHHQNAPRTIFVEEIVSHLPSKLVLLTPLLNPSANAFQ